MPKILSNISIQTSQQGIIIDPNELKMLEGVTQPIQTQIDDKLSISQIGVDIAPLDSEGLIPSIHLPESSLSFPIPITQGGTGTTTAPLALSALGGQPINSKLTSISNLSTNGFISHSNGSINLRTISVTTPLTITNGDGVSGNPTLALNMGPGSTLNADLLDGLESTSFLRKDQSDTLTGSLSITNGLTVTNGLTLSTGEITVTTGGLTINGNPIVQSVFGRTGAVTANASDYNAFYIEVSDSRLTDTRTPSDNSVTNIKVASNAAIAWTKIDKTGATEFASSTHNHTFSNLTGISLTTPTTNQLLQFNGTNWVNFTPTYISANQSITLSGDITGTGTTGIATSLSNTGVVASTYTKVTVDVKGRVTNGTTLLASDIPSLDWTKITTGIPTTLTGYGITDAWSTSGNSISNPTTQFLGTTNSQSLVLRTNNVERLVIDSSGNIGIGTSTINNLLSLGGNTARTIGMERHTTSNTIGNSLTIKAGGATAGATDKNGGDLILSSGISTGTGSSKIELQTVTAGTTGVIDRSPSTKMTILGSGNIGIGTTTPQEKLHINGNILLGNQAGSTDDNANYTIKSNGQLILAANQSGSSNVDFTNLQLIAGTANSSLSKVSIDVNGSERMSIYGNGRVGIGVVTPATTLDVGGNAQFSSQVTVKGSNGLTTAFCLHNSSKTGAAEAKQFIIYNSKSGEPGLPSSGGLHFYSYKGTDNSLLGTPLSILDNGYIGIGTLSPSQSLEVNGNITASSYMIGSVSLATLGKTYGSLRISGINSGYAGIYFSSVDRTLMSNGSTSGIFQETGGGSWDYYIDSNSNSSLYLGRAPATSSGFLTLSYQGSGRFQFRGDGYAWSAVHGWTPNWSDENLKRDISSLINCLDIVNQLEPVSFRWNSTAIISEVVGAIEDNHIHYGFIAQQIQSILPDIVKEGPEAVDGPDTYLTYEKTEIIPFLTGAIKELSAKLKDIEQRLLQAGI